MDFELSNNHRRYLGLELVSEAWNKLQLSNECYLYLDGNIIRKILIVKEEYYYESQMNEETKNKRSILLPKTKRGKETKLTVATIEKRNRYGNYFLYDKGRITIANSTIQQTYYSSRMASVSCNEIVQLQSWIENWISNTQDEYLLEINKFSKTERVHCNFKEGDFFRFKIDRGVYGYGRIIFNFDRLRKEKVPHWDILMGKPLIIKVYHIVTENKSIQLEKLRLLPAIPSQYIMDNAFYYGEYNIIGNLPLNEAELDFPIMYGQSISNTDPGKIIFQMGPVYKVIPYSSEILIPGDFKFNCIGGGLNVTRQAIEACIEEKSNMPYWNQILYINKGDLRNPQNIKERELVLKQFGEV